MWLGAELWKTLLPFAYFATTPTMYKRGNKLERDKSKQMWSFEKRQLYGSFGVFWLWVLLVMVVQIGNHKVIWSLEEQTGRGMTVWSPLKIMNWTFLPSASNSVKNCMFWVLMLRSWMFTYRQCCTDKHNSVPGNISLFLCIGKECQVFSN